MDENFKYQGPQAAQAHPKHDCFAWNIQGYGSSPEYTFSYCCVCETITGFRWRKFRHRVRSLFTSKQIQRLTSSGD